MLLASPDENGQCTTDSFMVRTTVGERLPILCGENNGQHLYVDMGRGSANPVVLSVVTNGDLIGRKWKVKINMIPCNNLDMAPSGCMQFFRAPSAIVQSFNYGLPVCRWCVNDKNRILQGKFFFISLTDGRSSPLLGKSPLHGLCAS